MDGNLMSGAAFILLRAVVTKAGGSMTKLSRRFHFGAIELPGASNQRYGPEAVFRLHTTVLAFVFAPHEGQSAGPRCSASRRG